MGAVVFDYPTWALRYPEFGAVTQPLAQMYFNEAALYVDNTACSLITDDSVGGQRAMLLNMVTAHIAAINSGVNGQAASPLVGRVSSASEGSVSVGVALDGLPGSAQWFLQTKYGLAYWQATAAYRTMRYIPGPQRIMDPYSPWV